MKERRRSGLLLHPTSLPGPWGIGDLGKEARRFVDFLAATGQTIWQLLPLSPTESALGESPYSSPSAMAGNLLLLSPEDLVGEGWLDAVPAIPSVPSAAVDYALARRIKEAVVDEAFRNLLAGRGDGSSVEAFRRRQAWWLDDHCLFSELKEAHRGLPWFRWAEPYRDRHEGALEKFVAERERALLKRAFGQYLFQRQWERLKGYGADRGVLFWGDLPIYPSLDSADVWSRSELFRLDAEGRPLAVAGVPPDYFSATGQLWGNPLYRWEVHEAERFAWWTRRLARLLDLFDRVRIDHFRGFIGNWAIPAGAETASEGHWEKGPGRRFLSVLQEAFPSMPFVAENLGVITDDVTEAMEAFGLPGMLVLLFGCISMGTNPYAPHNHQRWNVVYTGTHDNNTASGWWEKEATREERESLLAYLGLSGATPSGEEMATHLLRVALGSVACWSVTPFQDLLGLGEEARMNVPGKRGGNWRWRLGKNADVTGRGEVLSRLTSLTGRS